MRPSHECADEVEDESFAGSSSDGGSPSESESGDESDGGASDASDPMLEELKKKQAIKRAKNRGEAVDSDTGKPPKKKAKKEESDDDE